MSTTLISKLRHSRGAARGAWRRLKQVVSPTEAAPRYHIGPVWTNRLGLQIARMAWANAAWRLRSCPPTSAEARALADAMQRDGIVVVPDFLPPEQFALVRAEFDQVYDAGQYDRHWPEDNDVCEDVLRVEDHAEQFLATRSLLQESPLIRAVAAAVVRRPAHLLPLFSPRSWRQAARPQDDQRLTGAVYLHADVHYATCKAWLYLNDIDEDNGAFIYCRGSHRMTPARLSYEYDASIRVALARRNKHCHTVIPYGLVRIPSAEQIRAMGLREESICGRANTLVIANTQGFHRRGEFRDNRPREKVHLDFRNVESRRNRRQPTMM